MQPSLRGLKACTNLRWNDFTLQQNKNFTKAGKKFFYPACWNSNQGPVNVTLMLYKEQMASQLVCQSVQPSTLCLNAITEFCDLVPLQQFGEEGDDLVQGNYFFCCLKISVEISFSFIIVIIFLYKFKIKTAKNQSSS